MFFVVACAMLLAYFAMHACLGIMAQRMSERLRVLVFGTILRQEVGWFDRWVLPCCKPGKTCDVDCLCNIQLCR
jgi:hypothetical protein